MDKGMVSVVTGAAPLSIGEAIVKTVLEKDDHAQVIVLDRRLNKELRDQVEERGGAFIVCDLNPLKYGVAEDALRIFEAQLISSLKRSLEYIHANGIGVLYNNAGVYDFGELLDIKPQSLANMFGVNVMGHVSVLRSCMTVNEELGHDNSTALRLCELGSFQGVNIRELRSIYAPSKAFGIDFCTSLAKGREVERAMYIVVPPTDTPMLHYNHWVTKADGDIEFWQRRYTGNLECYVEIFENCNDEKFTEKVACYPSETQERLRKSFETYKAMRAKYFKAEGMEGVMFPREVAFWTWFWTSDDSRDKRGLGIGAHLHDCESLSGKIEFEIHFDEFEDPPERRVEVEHEGFWLTKDCRCI